MNRTTDEQIQHELAAMPERARAGLPPVGVRLESYLHEMLAGTVKSSELARLPREMCFLRSSEMAETLGVPKGTQEYINPYFKTVLADTGPNYLPASAVRTVVETVFHVGKKGPKIPNAKVATELRAIARMLPYAFNPPEEIKYLPYTLNTSQPTSAMVATYLRPLVRPKAGKFRRHTAEFLGMAPGGLVPDMHFPWEVFGGNRAGDPWMDDAGQDWKHWSGHTLGLVLAPQLTKLTKYELDLPYKDKNELYNDGQPFHLHLRNEEGNYFMLIGDTYLGYIKKGIKMMLRALADLEGHGEEHSGGVLVSWDGQILHIWGRGVSGSGKSELAKAMELLREAGGGTIYMRVGDRLGELKSANVLAITSGTGDDLTAYTLVVDGNGNIIKVAENIEYKLFDRTDGLAKRNGDARSQQYLANGRERVVVCNFEDVDRSGVEEILSKTEEFQQYHETTKDRLLGAPHNGYVKTIVPDRFRLVQGADGKKKPTRNPRMLIPRELTHNIPPEVLAGHRIDLDEPMTNPVNFYLWGTRNAPEDNKKGNPDFVPKGALSYLPVATAVTEDATAPAVGSPSTTPYGLVVGLEGAGTVGPFNSMQSIHVVESTYLDLVLTGIPVYQSISGFAGPEEQIDHDLRQFWPHLFVHMTEEERNPEYLIRGGYLEPYGDEELTILLGYGITPKFVKEFAGRLLVNPNEVITDRMLRPETQGNGSAWRKSVELAKDARRRASEVFFEDGSVDKTCLPLQILLHCMNQGHWNGKGLNHPDVKVWFEPETAKPLVLADPWYNRRLDNTQLRQTRRLERMIPGIKDSTERHRAEVELEWVKSPEYRQLIVGSLGAALIESETE